MRDLRGFLKNPWAVTIVGGVAVLLIGYFLFPQINAAKVMKQVNSGSGDNVAGDKITNNVSVSEKPDRTVPRDLTPEINIFLETIKDEEIQILYYQGDAESKRFAASIHTYLVQNGYRVNSLIGWQQFEGFGLRGTYLDQKPTIMVFPR